MFKKRKIDHIDWSWRSALWYKCFRGLSAFATRKKYAYPKTPLTEAPTMITTITQNLGKINQIQMFKFVINQKSLDTKVTGFTIQFDDFYFQSLSLNLSLALSLTLGLKILSKHISFNCRLLLYSKYGEGDSQLLLIIILIKRIKIGTY